MEANKTLSTINFFSIPLIADMCYYKPKSKDCNIAGIVGPDMSPKFPLIPPIPPIPCVPPCRKDLCLDLGKVISSAATIAQCLAS